MNKGLFELFFVNFKDDNDDDDVFGNIEAKNDAYNIEDDHDSEYEDEDKEEDEDDDEENDKSDDEKSNADLGIKIGF